jgi:hypothetical protein
MGLVALTDSQIWLVYWTNQDVCYPDMPLLAFAHIHVVISYGLRFLVVLGRLS